MRAAHTQVCKLGGAFWGFSPRKDNTLHRLGEINTPTPNFAPNTDL